MEDGQLTWLGTIDGCWRGITRQMNIAKNLW